MRKDETMILGKTQLVEVLGRQPNERPWKTRKKTVQEELAGFGQKSVG